MAYTGLDQMFMAKLKQLIQCNDIPFINDNPSILSERPQFQLLYQELSSILQTLSNIHQYHHHLYELEKVRNLKKRFKDTAEEAQDIIDLFLSGLHFRKLGLSPRSDVFKTSLDLDDVMTSIESIKEEFMTFNINDMKINPNEYAYRVRVAYRSRLGEGVTTNPSSNPGVSNQGLLATTQGACFRPGTCQGLVRSKTGIPFPKNNMKIDSSLDPLKTQSVATAVGPSYTINSLRKKKPLMEEIVVGLDRDVELIRDKLAEDTKQLRVISIVGMGGLGKTTLATKIFNDPFIVYHFRVRAWATVSQNYIKRDFLKEILASIGVQQGLEEANDPQLREKLHKNLMGKRYLIVIDDIWSINAWDDLKLFFPHDNTASRILLTSRLNEVALHAKPHGFVHSLPYLTEEESWELLREKVFNGDECPEMLIKPGMQIAKKCQGLPLSVVVMAGILAKEATSKKLWKKIASGVGSYIVSDQNGCLETLALSYHRLPHHLRECFLYLGGFPEDFRFNVKRLTWLWMAEGFIEEAGNRSLEDTAKAYLMDLIDRNIVIVDKRKFNGDVKACKLHDLVRELCLRKAEEERLFLKLDRFAYEVITTYKQRRVFANRDTYIVNNTHPPTPTIRSLLCFHEYPSLIYDIAEYFRSFALLRVLDLRKCRLTEIPHGVTLLVHLRFLAVWHSSSDFPSSICSLWSLQTLILKTDFAMHLPSNISDLVNLRHLWSNMELHLPSIEKPMNLQSISNVVLGDNFKKYFPNIKKLTYTLHTGEESHFELLPYLENLKFTMLVHPRKMKTNCYIPEDERYFQKTRIWFPEALKKLTLVSCRLPWSNMSIIQPLPNLEVLKLIDNAFEGTHWNAGEQPFQQLKFLKLETLNIKHWEAFSTSFPRLRRLAVSNCAYLKEIPIEIGEIATLELIEICSLLENSCLESVKRIQEEQHDEGNTELKITIDGMELSFYLSDIDLSYYISELRLRDTDSS